MTEKPDSQIPDPNGPPVAPTRLEELVKPAAIGMAGVMVLVGGAAALLALSVVGRPTSGALHSQRIQWQERQQEIAAAQAGDQANAAIVDPGAAQSRTLEARDGVTGHD